MAEPPSTMVRETDPSPADETVAWPAFWQSHRFQNRAAQVLFLAHG